LSVKKSKKGPLKQIVPQYQSLKQYYTLLWDMPSNEGYINTVAMMQKFFDQAISGNWSYNPTHYENNEVPMSVMLQDLLNTYKYGWKTSYYQNTYDYKTDGEEEQPQHSLGWHDNVKEKPVDRENFKGSDEEYEEYCEACAI
jgi:ribonucleoside-diphosphate reductase alpha chain